MSKNGYARKNKALSNPSMITVWTYMFYGEWGVAGWIGGLVSIVLFSFIDNKYFPITYKIISPMYVSALIIGCSVPMWFSNDVLSHSIIFGKLIFDVGLCASNWREIRDAINQDLENKK